MLKNASTALIVRGVLALIVGVIAIAWPSVTILALVIRCRTGKTLHFVTPEAHQPREGLGAWFPAGFGACRPPTGTARLGR